MLVYTCTDLAESGSPIADAVEGKGQKMVGKNGKPVGERRQMSATTQSTPKKKHSLGGEKEMRDMHCVDEEMQLRCGKGKNGLRNRYCNLYSEIEKSVNDHILALPFYLEVRLSGPYDLSVL